MSLQNYEYLHHLLRYVPDDNLEVGLLTGANCVKALEPLEVVNSKNDGPFAFNSRLGWGMTGPNKCHLNDSISCSRISVSTTTPFKDEEMKRMMEMMYHHDFNKASQLHGNDSVWIFDRRQPFYHSDGRESCVERESLRAANFVLFTKQDMRLYWLPLMRWMSTGEVALTFPICVFP